MQYVPNRFRAEAVNVGLILLCLDPRALRVRMTDNFERAQWLFGIGPPELKHLAISTSGLKRRIERCSGEFKMADDLAEFAASQANDLRLTTPRLAIVKNLDEDFERLFSQLVDDCPIVTS